MSMRAVRDLPGGSGYREEPSGFTAGSAHTFVHTPTTALALVAGELVEAERALHAILAESVPAVTEVCAYLASAGGKRFRPALTALGARAIGVTVSPEFLCVSELIHLGSLLHDDVIDGAHTRRGKEAANIRYGNGVAVLSGDYCLAKAVFIAAKEGSYQAVTALGEAVTCMAEGEVLQLQREGNLGVSLEEYLEVVERKSAALISWAAAAAAHKVDDSVAVTALTRFGRAAGIAFQITDDVLDFSEGTGKPTGGDIRQRKVTLPLLIAMKQNPSIRERLQLGPPSEAMTAEIITDVRATGALEAATAHAKSLIEEALTALEDLPANDGRAALTALGRHLVERCY
jgi:octaprenyl-diphosphate synthase